MLSHWAPHSFGLVPHRSKELCKLLCCNTVSIFSISYFIFSYLDSLRVVMSPSVHSWFFKLSLLSSCINIDVCQDSVVIWCSIFSVSICLWQSHWIFSSRFYCPHISSISRWENQPFFNINLSYLASLLLVLNLAYSVQISIIRFLYSLCIGVLYK